MRILDDIRSTLRGLRSKIPYLAVALATLAISMGAATAMFTIVNTFLLSSLLYEGADRLVMIWATHTETSKMEVDPRLPLSPGAFTDLRESGRNFEQVAALVAEAVNVTGADEPRRIHCLFVTGDFFPLLRKQAAVGRVLGPEDERPDATPVVVISDLYWRSQFDSDPGVIGRAMKIGGREYEVIGVLPADVHFSESLIAADPRFSKPVDVFAPLILGAGASERGFRGLVVVGRLRAEAGLEAAQAEVRAYARDAAERFPDTDKNYSMNVV